MTTPAIRTRYDERYSDIERIDTIGSDTRFHRGFGETGTRVLLMDCSAIGSCPRCGEDEMVVSLDLNPEDYDNALFYCTNLKCPHFVADEVEYDMDKIRADKPSTWDNTAECPDCGKRYTLEVTRHSRLHEKAKAGSSCIIEESCDDCVEAVMDEVDA